MRRALSLSALLLASVVASVSARPAHAAGADVDRAKALFNAGAQAYAAGQFDVAIQAFSEAQRILPRPAIAYSLAQAHRHLYVIEHRPENLRQAVDYFRTYLREVPEGGRRADAAQALMELEPRLATSSEASPSRTTAEPTRLMVTTQPTGAWVTLDRNERKHTPYGAEVKPGPHRIRVSLDGYFDEDREVLAVERALVPVPIELRPKPAHVAIAGPSGCEVTVDGRPAGTTPLAAPLELAAGTHLVVITKNGYKSFSQELDVARDENRALHVALEPTGQRIVADSLLISGGVLLLAGGVFSALALERQGAAKDVLDRGATSNITLADRNDYNDARDARDRWTTAAGVAFGVGGAALLTGLVFYVFDRPTASAPRVRPEERRRPPAPAPPVEPTEMSVRPVVTPTFAGAGIFGRF